MANYRACELGVCAPIKVIFGREYGVCPLKEECPREGPCGYAKDAADHQGYGPQLSSFEWRWKVTDEEMATFVGLSPEEENRDMSDQNRPEERAPKERRYILSGGLCVTCSQHMANEMMPPHDASPRCESGKRNHCSCDVCF